MSKSLRAVFAADAPTDERQFLREEPALSKGKSLKFGEGARMPTVSNKEGQDLYRL
jgi:hypothetical protein